MQIAISVTATSVSGVLDVALLNELFEQGYKVIQTDSVETAILVILEKEE